MVLPPDPTGKGGGDFALSRENLENQLAELELMLSRSLEVIQQLRGTQQMPSDTPTDQSN